jgi:uridylate kinase
MEGKAVDIQTESRNGVTVAVVTGEGKLIADVQSALDLMASVRYETGCERIAIGKEAVADDFFILSTRLAGDILQKFVNYQVKIAIYGDYSHYTSRPLRDFIRESNAGRDVFFVATREEALDKLFNA